MKDKSINNVSESQFTSASLVGVTVGHLPEVCLSDWRLGDVRARERAFEPSEKTHIYKDVKNFRYCFCAWRIP